MSAVVSSGFFSTRHALQSENQLLKREVAQLQSRIAGLEKSEEENAQLRDLVGMIQGPVGVTAPIVSSTRSSPYGTFLVGAGKVDGVVEGSIVMAGSSERGFVIGEVSDVQEHLSLVTEIFAPAVEIEASINGAPIVLKGQGGGNARGDTPRAVTVDVGDSVVAPSLGGRLIGVVGAVSSDPTDVYQRVYVRIPANFSTLQFVYVVPRPQ
jgi:cell shape-determining protein MreC